MENIDIFLRWDLHADSMIGSPTLLSLHQTLEGALAAIPENIRKYRRDEPIGKYEVTFVYEAIERRSVPA